MALFVVDLDILMFCLPRCVKSERGKKVTRKFCRGRLVDFVVGGVVVFVYLQRYYCISYDILQVTVATIHST